MDNCMGIQAEIMLNKNFVKIFDGIAGAAKSTFTHMFFDERGISYLRCCSTNKLKNDASERFQCKTKTVAAGLFKNSRLQFYQEGKDADFDTVVIDEILQTSLKVIDWVRENVGKVNIVICTDSRQMLSPGSGIALLNEFELLKKEEFCSVRHICDTMRAVNEKTRNVYQRLYMADGSITYNIANQAIAWIVKRNFGITIRYELPKRYSEDDVYLCHSNKIEQELYSRFGLFDHYDAPLIAKGNANKNPSKSYPVIPQIMAKSISRGYYQVANIATPTRYQGSEVEVGSRLYFLVGSDSYVSVRELYTVITRCKNVDSFYVGVIDVYDDEPLKSYAGFPILQKCVMKLNSDTKIDGDEIMGCVEIGAEGDKMLDEKMFYRIIQENMDSGNAYNQDYIMIGNEKIFRKKQPIPQQDLPEIDILTELEKEPHLQFQHMPNFMREFERAQSDYYRTEFVPMYNISPPEFCRREAESTTPFDSNGAGYVVFRKRKSFQYGLDLKNAYPHILKYATIPTGMNFEKINSAERINRESRGNEHIDWYMVFDHPDVQNGAIVTGELKFVLCRHTGAVFYYLGTTDGQPGCKLGNKLWGLSVKSQEHAKRAKSVWYGMLQKPYLNRETKPGTSDIIGYSVNERNVYILIMCAIKSKLGRIMHDMLADIYENQGQYGYTNVDCCYFDYDGDVMELGEWLERKYYPYNFRIFENGKENEPIYQTYVTAPTIKKRKAEEERVRRKKKKEIDGQESIW